MLPAPIVVALASGLAAPAGPAAVADGNIAQPCQWPTVVSFRAGEDKCSGTLVHPRVIVTAAHCLDDSVAGNIRFGEHFQPAAHIGEAERCGMDPQWSRTQAPSNDIGWCVLREAVEGIPATPLLVGCETGLMVEGTPAVIVGLGISEEDDDFGTKRYAFTTLDSDLRSDGTVWIGDALVNGCFGDSGGPAFIEAPGGTWHAVGVLAFGPDCGQGPVLYRSLHDRIGWLEQQTGFDLSPCHDPDGQWDPGPDCSPISADPLAGGTWDDRCDGALASAPMCPAPADPSGSGSGAGTSVSGATGAGSVDAGGSAAATGSATLMTTPSVMTRRPIIDVRA